MMKLKWCLAGTALLVHVPAVQAADRLHPVEQLCVEYEHSGMMSGTSTECHRNWGHERYTVEDLSMSMMGMTQRQNQHTVYIGDQIYSWDRDTLQGTVTTNPMYDDMVAASDSEVEDLTSDMIAAMGYQATGETHTIAGEGCTIWRSAQLGTACFTSDGIMLEQSMSQMGMGSMDRRAVAVHRGEAGEAANYEVPDEVTISTGPDLGQILGNFGN